MATHRNADELRARLGRARLMLLFTPELAAGDPLEVLGEALPFVDVVQVRVKASPDAVTPARELFDWTERVLDVVHERPALDVLVTVNDRVDVALALRDRGVAGVHLGADDCPPDVAREGLGPVPLIGLSTHDARQVVHAQELPVDYLGFGPIHATATKGYERGHGAEAAWAAHAASSLPVFPIGGIDATNAAELVPIGRAAVSSAILGAPDPAAAAAGLRDLLSAPTLSG